MASKGWAIELLGEEAVLRGIANDLPNHHNPYVEVFTDQGGDHFLLRDPKFDRVADPNAIRAEAMLCVGDLAGAWAAGHQVLAAITTGAVYQFDGSGQLVSRSAISVVSASGMGVVTGIATATTSGPVAPPRASRTQQFHALAKKHEPIRLLLRSTGQAADWVEIYKVYESAWEVTKLLGSQKLASYLGAEANRVEYMRWSSHHARHIIVKEPCPVGFGPEIMPLQEARQLAFWLSRQMLEVARQQLPPAI